MCLMPFPIPCGGISVSAANAGADRLDIAAVPASAANCFKYWRRESFGMVATPQESQSVFPRCSLAAVDDADFRSWATLNRFGLVRKLPILRFALGHSRPRSRQNPAQSGYAMSGDALTPPVPPPALPNARCSPHSDWF